MKEFKNNGYFVVFLNTAQNKKETTGQDKIVRARIGAYRVVQTLYRGFSQRGTHPVRAPSRAPCWIFLEQQNTL